MQSVFEAALSIVSPWFISEISFSEDDKRLDIYIDFNKGTHFPIDESIEKHPVYDTSLKSWRHLNFFEHECYLHCRTPRVKLPDGSTKIVTPPWAGKSNGFSLLFEAFLLQLCTQMPVLAVSRLTSVSDDKLWRMVAKYVSFARDLEDFESTTAIGIDETSRRKGHNYITIFVDLDERRTIYATEGKNSETVARFVKDFIAHNGKVKDIKDVTCDMSKSFIKGVGTHLPNAEITFDKFHILKMINESVDDTRRNEVKSNPILKHSRYVLLKSFNNLTIKEQKKLSELSHLKRKLKSFRAMEMRNAFSDLYQIEDMEIFNLRFEEWISWAKRSQIQEMVKVAKTLEKHRSGVVRWRKTGLSNGILEGLNSLIQAAKAKARGYSTFKNLRIMAYLVTGKLEFQRVNRNFKYITH